MSFKSRLRIIDSPQNCDLFLKEYRLADANKDELYEFQLIVSKLNSRYSMDAYVSLAQQEIEKRNLLEDREIMKKESRKSFIVSILSLFVSFFALIVSISEKV